MKAPRSGNLIKPSGNTLGKRHKTRGIALKGQVKDTTIVVGDLGIKQTFLNGLKI